MSFYKIIGKNFGNYPYRLGLNTLRHHGEAFNTLPECTAGGLYYCEPPYILNWFEHGDKLCRLTIPRDAQVVQVGNKFKADKINITHILSLYDAAAWKELSTINGDWNRQLQLATEHGYFEGVKYLVEQGADIHAEHEAALQDAAAEGHLKIVKYLVEHGADIYAANGWVLFWATKNGHFEVVKYLSELMGAIPPFALHLAIKSGHMNIVMHLKTTRIN